MWYYDSDASQLSERMMHHYHNQFGLFQLVWLITIKINMYQYNLAEHLLFIIVYK